MANPLRKALSDRMSGFGGFLGAQMALPKTTPMKPMGVQGTAVFGGYIQTKERDHRVTGDRKWITYADIVANQSIVAAGVRYFLNLVGNADWSVEPADDSPEAQEMADFCEDVMHDMATSWTRLARRSASYRFYGFGIQEWTAKRRDDGKIGFDDVEIRPQHTIERWAVDQTGTVEGVWQRSPQNGQQFFLPREKIIYLVDDMLTDAPDGMGLFRHIVEPAERLRRYLDLETKGFERDLRGIPIGRAPYSAISQLVTAGTLTLDQGKQLTDAIERFVQLQAKDNDTSIVLDSSPYISTTNAGTMVSSSPQWGVDLLTGTSSAFADIGSAINRLNTEIARVLSVEQLMLGSAAGSGNRALSEDKSRGLYLTVNSTLGEVADALDRDFIGALWDLNGFDEKLRPHLATSDISFMMVTDVTSALQQMAQAGAVLAPNDPAIDDVRDLLGISRPPEPTAEMMGVLTNPSNDNGDLAGGANNLGNEVHPGQLTHPAEEVQPDPAGASAAADQGKPQGRKPVPKKSRTTKAVRGRTKIQKRDAPARRTTKRRTAKRAGASKRIAKSRTKSTTKRATRKRKAA